MLKEDLLRQCVLFVERHLPPSPNRGRVGEGAKGGVGYQPVAVYWAEQDLVIADEYRDGNVPAGMNRSGRRLACWPESR